MTNHLNQESAPTVTTPLPPGKPLPTITLNWPNNFQPDQQGQIKTTTEANSPFMQDRNHKSHNSPHTSDLAPRHTRVPAAVDRGSFPAGPAVSEDDDQPLDFSDLTFRQQAALAIVAHAPTRAEAARLVGVGESTLRRWFTNPSFRRQVDLVRHESSACVTEQLQELLPLCVTVFADAMQSPDPPCVFAPPATPFPSSSASATPTSSPKTCRTSRALQVLKGRKPLMPLPVHGGRPARGQQHRSLTRPSHLTPRYKTIKNERK